MTPTDPRAEAEAQAEAKTESKAESKAQASASAEAGTPGPAALKGRLTGTTGLALVIVAWFISTSWAHDFVWHGPLMAVVALAVAYGVFLGFREAVQQRPTTVPIYLWYLTCILGICFYVSRFPGTLPAAIAVGGALGTYMVMHAPRPQGTPLRRLLIAFLMALVPLGWLAHDYWQALDDRAQSNEKNITLRLRREALKLVQGLGEDLDDKIDKLWAETRREDDSLDERVKEMADRDWVRFAFCADRNNGALVLATSYKSVYWSAKGKESTRTKLRAGTGREDPPDGDLAGDVNAAREGREHDETDEDGDSDGPKAHISFEGGRRIRLSELEPKIRKSFREELVRAFAEKSSDKTSSSINRTADGGLHYYLESWNQGRLWGVLVAHEYLLDEMAGEAVDESPLDGQIAIRRDTNLGRGETVLLHQDQMPHLWRFAVPVVKPGAFDEARDKAKQGRWFANVWFGTLLFWAIGALGRLYRTAREDVALAEMKANFVSAISHELKTPLAMIKMYSEMLLLGLVGSGKKPEDYHAIIIAETDRLTRLIDNVLDFSKIQKGTKKYHFEQVDLREVAGSALRTMEPVFDSEGVEFELDAPDSLLVQADRDAVHQALLNLLSNAAKYGGKSVRLRLFRKGREVHMAVQDGGPGIPRPEQRKIFRPFYRIGSEEQRTAQGTGLGLALVSEIMKAHKGDVRLQSKAGAGSTFTLTFPSQARA